MGCRIIGGKLPTVTFRYSGLINATGLATAVYTFSSVPVGTAVAKRWVVIRPQEGATLTSVTVNGNPAALVATATENFWIIQEPTGTTCTVVCTLPSAAPLLFSVMVWTVTDIASPVARSAATSTATPGVVNVNVPGGGLVIAVAYPAINGGSCTWSGVNLDTSQTSAVNNVPRSGASIAVTSGGTPRAVGVTYSASGAGRRAYAISLR